MSKNIFTLKKLAFTALMSSLAVAMSLLTIPFLLGVNIHLFQVAVFIAAVGGGPVSGIVTGMFGGVYMASVRGDIFIVAGNMLLGLSAGLLSRKLRPALACSLAWFLFQMPCLFIVNIYVYKIPLAVVETILITLTVEDLISAVVTDLLMTRFGLKRWVLQRLGGSSGGPFNHVKP